MQDADVYYEDTAVGPAAKAKQPEQPGGSQRIKGSKPRDAVGYSQNDQTATGENGVFDMRANIDGLIYARKSDPISDKKGE